jgi:low affinity Fe/Cu permease
MLSSNALKEIAAMYNVFIMTATQVNGTWEGKFVRNQNMIRDSKAIADKVDVGMVAVRCMDDEYMQVETYFKQLGLEKPNMVIDIYKNRRGSLTGVKLFRYFDYGTCRSRDLLVTTQNFKIDNLHVEQLKYDERIIDLLDFLSGGNVGNE